MNYDEPMKVGETVDVYHRSTPNGEPVSCELVSILNQEDGIIVVDDGTIRLARWIGSDTNHFEF